MADYANNYVTIDDADATTNWTSVEGDTLQLASTNSNNNIEGGDAIEFITSTGDPPGWKTIRIDNSGTGANKPFKITQNDFLIWFYYVKGKASNYLYDIPSAFTIRLWFGPTANNKYADYPQGGDSTIPFGWKTYKASGKRGRITGGTHNNGSDWDLDITRIDLRLNFEANNSGGTGGTPTPLLFDEARYGNNITISSGTSANPRGPQDLVNYDADDGSLPGAEERPLGVVSFSDNLLKLDSGLKVGTGSDGNDEEGHFAASGSFLLFNQGSEEVKYNLVVNTHSTCEIGELRQGIDGDYPVDGCQMVQPPSAYGKVDIKSGAIFRAFDTKFYRWRNLYLGGPKPSGAPTRIEFRRVDIDSCETVFINKPVIWDDVEVHDNAALVSAHSGQILTTPTEFRNVKVYNCKEGFHFTDDVKVEEYFAADNEDYDLGVLGGKTATIVDGTFDENKIKRVLR